MKRFGAMLLGGFLLAGLAGCGRQPSEADQKWLTAVEKLVVNGATRISTPSAHQAELLKQWAAGQGFGVAVARSTNGYRVDLMKRMPQPQRISRQPGSRSP